MDTLKDKLDLERMWQTKQAPWKIWEENNQVSIQDSVHKLISIK